MDPIGLHTRFAKSKLVHQLQQNEGTMPQDTAVFRSRRPTDASAPPGSDRPVAVLPAAFAVGGGTYQRLIPCGCAWQGEKRKFSLPDEN